MISGPSLGKGTLILLTIQCWTWILILCPRGFPAYGYQQGKETEINLEEIDVSTVAHPFSLHGRIDLTFIHFPEGKNVDGYGQGFFRPLAPALFLGYEFSDTLSGLMEIGIEGDEGGIEIDQIVLDWHPVKDLFQLRLGNSYFPFGIERRAYAPSSNKLIDRPSPFRRIIPGTYSDLGLFISGRYLSDRGIGVSYEIALTNGLEGPERSDRLEGRDNNNNKNFGLRIGFLLAPRLELGLSYAVQEYDKHQKYQLDFWGMDLQLQRSLPLGEIDLRAEYVESHVERDERRGGDYRRYGYYVQTGYRYGYDPEGQGYLEFILRYDRLDDNTGLRNFRDVGRWALGLIWSPLKNLRFKGEYEINRERYQQISNDGLFWQIEYHW